jgi:hypothetical protein
MSFGAISGILSAHTLLLAKSAVELLVRTIVDKVNQFNQWQSWMILLGLVALALLQLYFLHRGLKLVSTSVLYPFVFCIYNVIAILDGLIYFDQGPRLPLRDALLIAVGTVVLLCGVFALSWRLQADDDLPGPTAVDIKAKARVVTPRTILQPGLGIEPDSESESVGEESPFLRPADDEEALQHAHKLHLKQAPTEHTPLLRTKTGPMRPISHIQTTEPALRPPKLRRMTTIQDDSTIDLWDELNDRPGSRRFSTEQQSPRSPITPRSQHNRRSVSGPRKSRTLSLSNRPRRSSTGLKDLAQMPWRYFSGQQDGSSEGSKKRVQSRDFGASPPPMSDPDDEEGGGESSVLLGDEAVGRGVGGEEARPDWFRLQRWWKKRWRSEDEV